jgi:hypothetical protein
MQRSLLPASLLALALASLALAGCTQSPQAPGNAPPPPDGTTTGTSANATLDANMTGGNATVSGNATTNATAEPNATGNETGNVSAGAGGNGTGNGTGNATEGNASLVDQTVSFSPQAPADLKFTVDRPFLKLTANATASGTLVNVAVSLVDPGGNATPVLQPTTTTGTDAQGSATVQGPAQGAWTLHFDGFGMGTVRIVVQGS